MANKTINEKLNAIIINPTAPYFISPYHRKDGYPLRPRLPFVDEIIAVSETDDKKKYQYIAKVLKCGRSGDFLGFHARVLKDFSPEYTAARHSSKTFLVVSGVELLAGRYRWESIRDVDEDSLELLSKSDLEKIKKRVKALVVSKRKFPFELIV